MYSILYIQGITHLDSTPHHRIPKIERFPMRKGSFTLERSRAERSKDHNKATAVTTRLQRSNAAQSVDMPHWAMSMQ